MTAFDLHDIVGVSHETFTNWDADRRRRAVETALNYDRYVPPSPATVTPADCTQYNPGIDVYQVTHDWGTDGWEPIDDTIPFRSAPAYLPTDAALDVLTDMHLLEIGAGSGYWAHVITEAGGDIIPTDIRPPEIAADATPPVTTQTIVSVKDGEQIESDETLWADVREADHQVITDYPDRDVLLCHPEAFEWTLEVLELLGAEQRLVLVAEWYPGHDAVPKFFQRLDQEWELDETFPVLDWASMHARGYVFSQG